MKLIFRLCKKGRRRTSGTVTRLNPLHKRAGLLRAVGKSDGHRLENVKGAATTGTRQYACFLFKGFIALSIQSFIRSTPAHPTSESIASILSRSSSAASSAASCPDALFFSLPVDSATAPHFEQLFPYRLSSPLRFHLPLTRICRNFSFSFTLATTLSPRGDFRSGCEREY